MLLLRGQLLLLLLLRLGPCKRLQYWQRRLLPRRWLLLPPPPNLLLRLLGLSLTLLPIEGLCLSRRCLLTLLLLPCLLERWLLKPRLL